MRHFGLIGFPLSHSFSKKYFSEKFDRESISGCTYELYPIEEARDFLDLFKLDNDLLGLNVTIPHKQAVIPFLDKLDPLSSARIGAVNVIRREKDGILVGYNSDYYGFKSSLTNFLGQDISKIDRALILGKGGAALAVQAALEDLGVQINYVSRKNAENSYSYEDLNQDILGQHKLIINTTPLGMYPNIEDCPHIPYEYLTKDHFLYDLVYNPEVTLFMKRGNEHGAKTTNGMDMLILQAEKAWQIWNQN